MTVSIAEEFMAQGRWAMDMDWDAELYARIVSGSHVLAYEGERLIAPPLVVKTRTPGEQGMTFGGPGFQYHWGSDADGYLIVDREYIAGSNRLTDPGFEATEYHDGILRFSLWSSSQESQWRAETGAAHSGAVCARSFDSIDSRGALITVDDVLVSQDSFEVRPGQRHQLALYVFRSYGAIGRVHLRTVYTGRFRHPDILVNGNLEGGAAGWAPSAHIAVVANAALARTGARVIVCSTIPRPNLANDPGFETGTGWALTAGTTGDMATDNTAAEAFAGTWSMRCGPNAQPQSILNPSFESGLNNWREAAGSWGPTTTVARSGTHAADIGGDVGGTFKLLFSDAVTGGVEQGYPLLPNRRYRFAGFIRPGATADGHAAITVELGQGSTIKQLSELGRVMRDNNTADRWNEVAAEVTVPPDIDYFVIALTSENQTASNYYFDDITGTLISGNTATVLSTQNIPVNAGTTYQGAARLRSKVATTGGSVTVGVILQGAGMEPLYIDVTQDELTGGGWAVKTFDVTVGDGYTTATRYITCTDVTGAAFHVDDFTFIQQDNNRETMPGTPFPVIGERTYRWSAFVRNDLRMQRGTVALQVTLTGPGRPAVVVDVGRSVTEGDDGGVDGTWMLTELDITPPSGYDLAAPAIVATDVEGGSFYLDDMSIRDADDKTWAYDTVSPATASAWVQLVTETTAPFGADHIHMEVVAESVGQGWLVDDASLRRIGEPLATHADVFRSLLTDPATGGPIDLLPGIIEGSRVIPWDLHVLNRMTREFAEHFVTVVADPPMEWRVNPDRTVDAGPAIGVDHAPGTPEEVILLEGQLDVTALPSVDEDTTGLVSEIVVIGAQRESPVVGAPPRNITATARRDIGELDWSGQPVKRQRLIEDSTADNPAYAQALAEYHLARNARPSESVTATLGDTRGRPVVRLGDWVYGYKPASGLEDPSIPGVVKGRTVFPKRLRVTGTTRELGPGFRLVARLPTGEEIDLPHRSVRWAKVTSTTLALGDRPRDFLSDAGEGSASSRLTRLRASMPR